jgi:hypothetical protein
MLYNRWRGRHPAVAGSSGGDDVEHQVDDDLRHVLQYARLIHWCRTPVLFNVQTNGKYNVQPGNSVPTDLAKLYFPTIATRLIERYCAYLKSLGLVIICQQRGRDTYDVSQGFAAPCDRVYMQRAFMGGILLLEISFSRIFLSVNIFTVNRRFGLWTPNTSSSGASIESVADVSKHIRYDG